MNITVDERIAAIRSGPPGPSVGAFFDLDGTLVTGYTALHFFRDRLRRRQIGTEQLARIVRGLIDGSLSRKNAVPVFELAADIVRGSDAAELDALFERLFRQRIARTVRWPMREVVRAHEQQGHTVVIASSATQFQVGPVAEDLGIEHVLCSRLEIANGKLTGKVQGPVLWGEEKARAVLEFAEREGINRRDSYAYGNGDEDEAFLFSMGRPAAVNPESGLEAVAKVRGWPILKVDDPPGTTPVNVARTLAALAGLNAGLLFSWAGGMLTGRRREMLNHMTPHVIDLTLALAGVKTRVVGAAHLENARPGVFIFNHQSNLDPLVVARLIERDFTGVSKKEARFDPRGLAIGQVMDVTFIDRSNPESAKRSVAALAEKIRSGTSVMIAPEGTRMPTQRLGRFKKGAFHLAMAAGVPIVPIVLRNSGELMAPGATVITAGTIDVAVLEPVPTGDWSPDTLDELVRLVRSHFEDALEHWPGDRTHR